jgi:hypothetical protein
MSSENTHGTFNIFYKKPQQGGFRLIYDQIDIHILHWTHSLNGRMKTHAVHYRSISDIERDDSGMCVVTLHNGKTYNLLVSDSEFELIREKWSRCFL